MKILPKEEFLQLAYQRNLELGLSKEDAVFEAMSTGGLYTTEGEIILPEGSRTKVKLHELGHQKFGPSKIIEEYPERVLGDVAHDEIVAEKYAWDMRGKEITYRVGVPAVYTLMYDERQPPRNAVAIVVLVLEKYMGIPVPRGGRAELLRWAKKYRRAV